VIIQQNTTVFLESSDRAVVDEYANLVVTVHRDQG
jgi:hypothetical protein